MSNLITGKPPFDAGFHILFPFINFGFWAVLSPIVWYIVNRYRPEQVIDYRKLLIWIISGIFLSVFHEICTNLIYHGTKYLMGNLELTPEFYDNTFYSILGGFFSRFMEYWMVFIGLTIWGYYQAFKKQKLKLAQIKAELFETKLEVLKAQLQPHFLFNTLNSVSALMTRDVQKAQRVLSNLAQLLRTLFKHDKDHMVTLSEELDFIQGYLEIEAVRFSDRLQVVYKIDQDTKKALVPRLILQPLVENSLKHGISKSNMGGEIVVTTCRSNDRLMLTVSDNGKGMPNKDQIWKMAGIGLKNTRERLEQLYEEDQHIEIESYSEKGFMVKLEIPFEQN